MSSFLETKQQTQATTIENLRLETGWKFTALLIKETECTIFYGYIFQMVIKMIYFFGKSLSPNVGLEPTTLRLRVSCSTD